MRQTVMNKSVWMWAAALLAVATWIAPAKVAQAQSGSGKTRITLSAGTAFPAAKGKATFRARPNEREVQVEVENVKALAGTTLNVFLGGNPVGTITVGALGAGTLNVNSMTLPASVAGMAVDVKQADGTVVVSGSF